MHTILCALAGLVKGESKMEGGFFGTKPGKKKDLSSGLIPQGKKIGMTYKNVGDYGRAQLSPPRIEKIFSTGVEKTEFFSLLRIHSEQED
jgi:hypothetical protein